MNQVLTETNLPVSSLLLFDAALSPVWNPACLGCCLANDHWGRGCFGRYCMDDNQGRNKNGRSCCRIDNHWQGGCCGHCHMGDNLRRSKLHLKRDQRFHMPNWTNDTTSCRFISFAIWSHKGLSLSLIFHLNSIWFNLCPIIMEMAMNSARMTLLIYCNFPMVILMLSHFVTLLMCSSFWHRRFPGPWWIHHGELSTSQYQVYRFVDRHTMGSETFYKTVKCVRTLTWRNDSWYGSLVRYLILHTVNHYINCYT